METTYTLNITTPATPGLVELPRSFSGLTFQAVIDKLVALTEEIGVFGTVRIIREREVSSR